MTPIDALRKSGTRNPGDIRYELLFNLALPILFLFLTYFHLFDGFLNDCPVAVVSICAVDIYVFLLMVLAALKKPDKIPDRDVALITIPALLLILVMSFAKLYIDNKHVWRLGIEDKDNREPLVDPWDAVYFSATTITTLGYGDFSPQEWSARKIVRFELMSGGLLLFLAFPVLGSRLAMFDDAEGILIRRLKDGSWEVKSADYSTAKHPPDKRVTVIAEADGTVKVNSEA